MNTAPFHVLLAEDNPAHVEAIRRAFETAGMKVDLRAVATLREYRACLTEWTPNLALVDLNLPDGRAVELLTHPPEDAAFPVLVMTAFGTQEIVVEVIKAGAMDYVVKSPDAFAAMPHTVERVFREWQLLQGHKQVEAALKKNEAKYGKMLANIGDVIVIIDQNGINRYKSSSLERLFGWRPEEVVGAPALDNVHPEDLDHAREFIGSLFREPHATGQIECRYRCKDGRYKWINFSGVNLSQDPDIQGVLGNYHDITERKRAETVMRESEAKYRSLVETTGTGYLILDGDGRVLDANPEYVRQSGHRELREIVGRSVLEWTADYERERNAQAVASCMRNGFIRNLTIDYVDGAGRVTPVEINATTEGNGPDFHVVSLCRDITERKHAEAALRGSEAQFRAMFELASIGMAQADTQTGQWEHVNQKMCAITGYSADEMLQMRVSEITHPEDRAADWEAFQRVVRGETPDYRLEKRYLRKDGTVAWVNVNMTVIRDAAGVPTRTMATIEDISERKHAEQERLRLTMAMEQATDSMVITDHEGAILYVNPAFEKITGYSRQEAMGMNPRLLKSGRHDAAFYRRMWAMLAAGEVWSGRLTNKRKDGTLYEEDATISPMRNTAGKVVNYVAVKRDVTREVQLEAQLRQAQKMESVGRLAGGIAHDFNNLLMGIMNYAELCRDKIAPDHPIREYLDELTRDAQRSAEITRQLPAFARKQTIAPKVMDLNDAVNGMLNMLRRLIGEDIKLAWRPGINLRPVKLDPSQVDQILANLCVNSRDAIAGVGEITLETGSLTADAAYCASHPEALPGSYVFLAITDDGCGMDPETLAQVFEPFFTTKDLGKGTGLGLATVYGIVKQNNGFICATSEPGKGTTFRICLPEIAAAPESTPVTRKTASPRGRGETILMVEDENSIRVTCGEFLNTLGYKVLVAETPGEALKLLAAHPGDIHLLLTDVIMPEMDGKQLAERIGALKPDIRVVFMSGYTDDVVVERSGLDEGVHFLAKPFSRDDLARKLRQVLDSASA